MEVPIVFCILFVLVLVVVIRCLYLARRSGVHYPHLTKRTTPCCTMIVMGSGGHTSEMMRIVGGLDPNQYTPRIYVLASGDKMSEEKVKAHEQTNATLGTPETILRKIPRARKVLQSYFTSIFTTLAAIFSTCTLVLLSRPDLVLCNGPGTCIPVCIWAHLLKFVSFKETKVIYVESICRVQKLSLSGIILYYSRIADWVFVQWPQLTELYPRTKFIGRIL